MPEIGFLNVSIIGGILILLICILRKLSFISKRTIVRLWSIVIVRLLIIVAIPSLIWIPVSTSLITDWTGAGTKTASTVFQDDISIGKEADLTIQDSQQETEEAKPGVNSSHTYTVYQIFLLIWKIGVCIGMFGLIICYLVHTLRARTAEKAETSFVNEWLQNHRLRRTIQVKTIKETSPYTYGVWFPKIIVPDNYDQISDDDLDLVLLHEWCHIRRADVLRKYLFLLALILNWYNPLVYLAYHFLREDIEQACDEDVLAMRGQTVRSEYAMALVHLAEMKNQQIAAGSGFGSYPLKRRIEHIMDTKNFTKWQRWISCICLIMFLTFGCLLSLTGCHEAKGENTFSVNDLETWQGIDWIGLIWQNKEIVENTLKENNLDYSYQDEIHIKINDSLSINGKEYEMVLHFDPELSLMSGFSFRSDFDDEDSYENSISTLDILIQEASLKYGSVIEKGPDNRYLTVSDPATAISRSNYVYEMWDLDQIDDLYLTIKDSKVDEGTYQIMILYQVTLIYR